MTTAQRGIRYVIGRIFGRSASTNEHVNLLMDIRDLLHDIHRNGEDALTVLQDIRDELQKDHPL